MNLLRRRLGKDSKDNMLSHARDESTPTYSTLILGYNTAMALLLDQMGDEEKSSVALVTEEKDFLVNHTINQGLLLFRGEVKKCLEQVNSMALTLQIAEEALEVKYYRDHLFRPISDRLRPHIKLTANEHYFMECGVPYSLNLTSSEKAVNHFKRSFKSISFLQECRSWEVAFHDGDSLIAKKLVVAIGPQRFFQLLTDKSLFPEDLVTSLGTSKRESVVLLKLTTKQEVFTEKGTLFIPKSLTHELGHFIGNVSPFSLEQGVQNAFFFWLPSESESSSDEITRALKNLKRQLQKVFPRYERACVQLQVEENIYVGQFIPSPIASGMDDYFINLRSIAPSLYFMSMDAPLNPEYASQYAKSQLLERELLSYQQFSAEVHQQ
ncbi:MAG: hypothetical protein HQK50_12130 [Oligoflexia bacterium]|nr:hypothetical protein [Oligoflexia bacterium]MBF0366313.1 hypothetical protein [Oligoflexia bacterium]